MMKKLLTIAFLSLIMQQSNAQIDAGLFRYPDVSRSQIVFTYANDLWIAPKEGGMATKLSSPAGVETFPKFSPDGRTIAFSGNYDGNRDAYTLSTAGGIPVRLTSHGNPDRVVDWTTDGKYVVIASNRESGIGRFNQFYKASASGGPLDKMPLAYAEYGSFSGDGNQMAVTFRTQVGRYWKRYRGGWKADIHVFNFADKTSKNISSNDPSGNDFPMWHINEIYFLSDRGPELKMNLWRYNISTKSNEQVTHFKDVDIHFPSAGPDDIVFEAGGKMYLLDFATRQTKEVKINLVMDKSSIKEKIEKVETFIENVSLSPDGNRVLVEARGDIFSLPAENGFVKNITRTSGTAERAPAWSPDGKNIAYWSDGSGEYELWLQPANKEEAPKKLTNYGAGFRYDIYWSPDSKKIAFIDKGMKIRIYNLESSTTTDVDKALHWSHGALSNFTCDWSPDSRWLTYNRDMENSKNAIFIFDTKENKLHQVTAGFYDARNPVFDSEGKYLYLFTAQNFQPYYSELDNSFIYANSRQIGVIALQKSSKSILYPKNDAVEIKKSDEVTKVDVKEKSKTDTAGVEKTVSKVPPVNIDIDGFESRMVILPLAAARYGQLGSVKGKILYIKLPGVDGTGAKRSLKYYDIDKREEKTILDECDGYQLSADRQKILAQKGSAYAVIKPADGQKFEKPIRTSEMQMTVEPKEEWTQLFNDAWRIERDYFYDPNMHGVNWNELRQRYSKMMEGAANREEVSYVISEMIGELNASHTYNSGGVLEREKSENVGYLGVNWQAEGKYYKISRIIRGAAWDATARSSIDQAGADIKEGSYILAVNGTPVTTDQEPYGFFQGLADKTVELTYNSSPSWEGAKTALVQTMRDEGTLRYQAWVENNRKRVETETNGDVGYIYVPSTGVDGQNELIRQFTAQWDKKALIIDERFNGGGQIPDRFIEILNRSPLAYWAVRDGSPNPWPPFAHFGPKVMLVNGWSGSGGDAFPDYFRRKGLGPLIGMRTWGGLIGISGVPNLIDGGQITAPSFRMLNPDGTWFREGHGVDPDIVVDEDLGSMAKGIDPQLEKSIEEIKSLLKNKGYKAPAMPEYENRFKAK